MASHAVNRSAILTWLFLVIASVATWLLVEGGRLSAAWTVSLILAIAAIKARTIVLHYMELKHAPLRWRLALELWCVAAAALILGIWFFTGSVAITGS